jgi:hypothetical protein
MHPHEWIGRVPVPARVVLVVNHQNGGVRTFAQQRFDKGHCGCASADGQVVGLQRVVIVYGRGCLHLQGFFRSIVRK